MSPCTQVQSGPGCRVRRSPGWPSIARRDRHFSARYPPSVQGDESGFRLAVLPFGCLLVLSTWLLGRRIHGPLTGLLAACLVATASEIQLSTGSLLNDVPSAAVLVFGMAIIWRAMERDEVGNSIRLAGARRRLRLLSPLRVGRADRCH